MSALVSPLASLHPYKGVRPELAAGVLVLCGARLSGRLTVGVDSSIWYNCVVRADVNSITIGERTNIQDASVLHVTDPNPLTVGHDCVIGHGAILHACTIGDGVMIGMGAMVLDGAVIPSGSVVAAGSVVPPGKKFDEAVMLMGSPAKPVRPISDHEKQFTLLLAQKYLMTAKETAKSLGLA